MTNIAFSRPFFKGDEGARVAAAIESRWVAQGPRVADFERAVADRVGAPEAVAVSSGTAALQLALLGLGVGPGDEVVVPSLTFIATANAVRHCGAEPVFADIDPLTYNLDPEAAAAVVSDRTKALMPVHQIGLAADMDAFRELAEARGLALVEDAAPALGAKYKGREVGALGPVACFSFHARKVITTGEGGMIVTGDPELAARLRRLRHHGMSISDLDRHAATDLVFETYDEVGFNFRMSDIQAALGLAQIELLDEALARRRRLAERYAEGLGDNEHIGVPVEPDGYGHSWQSYAVRLSPDAPLTRDDLMRKLLHDGIATRRGVTASHLEPPYRDTAPSLPHTEAAARETMLLPLYPDLTEREQDLVVERLRAHLGG
jgi:perosamine synthetase